MLRAEFPLRGAAPSKHAQLDVDLALLERGRQTVCRKQQEGCATQTQAQPERGRFSLETLANLQLMTLKQPRPGYLHEGCFLLVKAYATPTKMRECHPWLRTGQETQPCACCHVILLLSKRTIEPPMTISFSHPNIQISSTSTFPSAHRLEVAYLLAGSEPSFLQSHAAWDFPCIRW